MPTETRRTSLEDSVSKEQINAARRISVQIVALGGPDLTKLSDAALVARIVTGCQTISETFAKICLTFDEAASAFTRLN